MRSLASENVPSTYCIVLISIVKHLPVPKQNNRFRQPQLASRLYPYGFVTEHTAQSIQLHCTSGQRLSVGLSISIHFQPRQPGPATIPCSIEDTGNGSHHIAQSTLTDKKPNIPQPGIDRFPWIFQLCVDHDISWWRTQSLALPSTDRECHRLDPINIHWELSQMSCNEICMHVHSRTHGREHNVPTNEFQMRGK